MALKIHTLMENPNDVDALTFYFVEDHVMPGTQFPIAFLTKSQARPAVGSVASFRNAVFNGGYKRSACSCPHVVTVYSQIDSKSSVAFGLS
ncbi:MAG: hypothetical protein R3F11_00870 [Verrucomicrobiales bacterium]